MKLIFLVFLSSSLNNSIILNPYFLDILLQKIRQEKFSSPTIIQSMCWPILMSGNDIVGIAQTGSGKTLGVNKPNNS
jgi:superfamily II DNA/RNA helicase